MRVAYIVFVSETSVIYIIYITQHFYEKMIVDSDCIARLLASVERGIFKEIERPTDAFARQLFVEEEVFFQKVNLLNLSF